MEPMKPEVRERIKQFNPAVTDAEIDEYELLLSQRTPDGVPNPRLQELFYKMFKSPIPPVKRK